MPGPLKWLFEIVDRMSGPAEKMSKEVDKVSKSIDGANSATERMVKAQKEISAERIAFLTEGAHLAAEGIELLTDKVIEFGREVLRTADAERSSQLILSSLVGSSEGGAQLFEKAEDYASKAGIKIQSAVEIFRTLAAGGVKDVGENVFVLAQAAGDIGARTNTSAESVVASFKRILLTNQLTGREVRSAADSMGIPVEILGKKLGISADNAKDLGTALDAKKLSGGDAVNALVASLQQLEGGQIGKLRQDLGEGFEGASNRIANSWDKTLGSFQKTQAFQDILKYMDHIAVTLEDPAFGKAIEGFASSMLSVAKWLEQIVPSAQTLHNLFGGGLGEKAADLISSLNGDDKPDTEKSWYNGAWNVSKFFDGGKRQFKAQEEGFKEAGEIRSPSKVYERFGAFSAQGFNQGFGKNVEDELTLPEAIAPSRGQSATGHGASVNVHNTFNLHDVGQMDIETLAQRIAEISASALTSPLENLAISIGGM
jgi:Tape measure protein